MPLKPDDVFHGFRNWLIKESELAWEQSLKDWTNKIKEYFGKLGKEEGFHPIYTSATDKEYLADIVWRVDGPKRYLGLAVESELSKSQEAIIEDFEKLIDIKALLKVGLFHLPPQANEPRLLEDMKNILNSQMFMLQNEAYLVIFLRFDYDKEELVISGYDLDLKGTMHREIHKDSYPFPRSLKS